MPSAFPRSRPERGARSVSAVIFLCLAIPMAFMVLQRTVDGRGKQRQTARQRAFTSHSAEILRREAFASINTDTHAKLQLSDGNTVTLAHAPNQLLQHASFATVVSATSPKAVDSVGRLDETTVSATVAHDVTTDTPQSTPTVGSSTLHARRLPSALAHVMQREEHRSAQGAGSCETEYGVGWIDKIRQGLSEVCSVRVESLEGPQQVRVSCVPHVRNRITEAHCEARYIRINPKQAVQWVDQPGERNPNKPGFPPELNLDAAASIGRNPAECSPNKMPPTGLGAQKFLMSLLNGPAQRRAASVPQCTLTIRDPVLFAADKYGGENPWHSMEDTTHIFSTLSAFDFPADRTRILLADRPTSGPPLNEYMGMWGFVWDVLSGGAPVSSLSGLLLNATELASAVDVSTVKHAELGRLLRDPHSVTPDQMRTFWVNQGQDDMALCFARTAFTVHGGMSLLSSHIATEDTHCPRSPLVLGLADMILSRVEGGTIVPASHAIVSRSNRRLRILFLIRGGSKTNDKSRQLPNRESLKAAIAAIPNVHVEMLSFDDLPKRRQLEEIRSADIFIGLHGAGLTWLMLLPETSAIIELSLSDGRRCHCFNNLAHWTGHPYAFSVVPNGNYARAVDDVRNMIRVVHDGIDRLHMKSNA